VLEADLALLLLRHAARTRAVVAIAAIAWTQRDSRCAREACKLTDLKPAGWRAGGRNSLGACSCAPLRAPAPAGTRRRPLSAPSRSLRLLCLADLSETRGTARLLTLDTHLPPVTSAFHRRPQPCASSASPSSSPSSPTSSARSPPSPYLSSNAICGPTTRRCSSPSRRARRARHFPCPSNR
jgi:hypothetical protein